MTMTSLAGLVLLLMLYEVRAYKLQGLRVPKVLDFDTSVHPIREALVTVLEDECKENLPLELGRLHEATAIYSSFVEDKSGNKISYLQNLWNQNRDRMETTPAYQHFELVYKTFLEDVIKPMGMECGNEEECCYQRAPTFRAYLPGTGTPMGKLHCDRDYHHQPTELNFWMPLSEHVFGTNSLFVESEPGKGDFESLDLRYGQCYRGYLNQCRHGARTNDSNVSRLSIDFRLVKRREHDPTFRKGVRRGAKARFQDKFDVGGFYEVV